MKCSRRSSTDLRGGRWRTDGKETSDRQVGPVVGMALVGVKEVVAGDLRIHGLVESGVQHGTVSRDRPITDRPSPGGTHVWDSWPRVGWVRSEGGIDTDFAAPTIHLRVA